MSDNLNKNDFWNKVGNYAGQMGRSVVLQSLKLYYAWQSPSTPMWAKAVVVGALVYFISPVDAIPDFIPGVGYVDDAGVLAGAVSAIAEHIDAKVERQADRKLKEWFD